MIASAGKRLPAFDDPAFGAWFDRFASRKIVALGEATHGTSEYLWFDQTTAVTPLGPEHRRSGLPETYPFGQ